MINIEFIKDGGQPDILVVPIFKDQRNKPTSLGAINERLFQRLESKDFMADKNEILSEIFDESDLPKKVLFVGLGEKKELTPEGAKTIGAKLVASFGDLEGKTLAFSFNAKNLKTNLSLKLLEGMMLRNYLDVRYQTGESLEKAKKKLFSRLQIIGLADAKFKDELNEINNIIEGVFLCRDLVSAPPVDMKPEDLANVAKDLANDFDNLVFRSLNKKEIEKEGMGLLSAVNRGSVHEPRLIILELNQSKKEKPIVLIGKGLTFDAGGYNLKPTGGIEDMHIDMAGGATVLGAMKALALLGVKKRVVAIVPATENLISGDAYKPSDIITAYNGLTVEIQNTDAEGRLILADALSFAEKTFEPKLMVDLATLTGACMVALGERHAGIFSHDADIIKLVEKASKDSGDKVWNMPLDDGFKEKMKSKVADLGNVGDMGRLAGASTAAAFLSNFVGDTPWIHIDIAGPTKQAKDMEAWTPPSGITGYGVALLVNMIKNS